MGHTEYDCSFWNLESEEDSKKKILEWDNPKNLISCCPEFKRLCQLSVAFPSSKVSIVLPVPVGFGRNASTLQVMKVKTGV
ncbi:hypothetical protein Q3G72_011416 [Acer saccharum]|nr:hypothetical protein Q3G72_011416 [Acer saccharum]